jgi:hypothetical protein
MVLIPFLNYGRALKMTIPRIFRNTVSIADVIHYGI